MGRSVDEESRSFGARDVLSSRRIIQGRPAHHLWTPIPLNETEIIVSRFRSSFNARSAESNDTTKIFLEEFAPADESSK